jgi:hypothetical protein
MSGCETLKSRMTAVSVSPQPSGSPVVLPFVVLDEVSSVVELEVSPSLVDVEVSVVSPVALVVSPVVSSVVVPGVVAVGSVALVPVIGSLVLVEVVAWVSLSLALPSLSLVADSVAPPVGPVVGAVVEVVVLASVVDELSPMVPVSPCVAGSPQAVTRTVITA